LILELKRDALIADVLRKRLEKIVWHVDIVISLHPKDSRTLQVQPFKPNSSLLKFLLSLKLMVNRRAQSEIGQVTSDQDDIRLRKFLEVEGIVLAVNVTDRQDSHSGIVVPGRTGCLHQPNKLCQNVDSAGDDQGSYANARDASSDFIGVTRAASQQNLATMRFFVKPENPRQRMGRVQETVRANLAYWET
jgi:hypothetical protein